MEDLTHITLDISHDSVFEEIKWLHRQATNGMYDRMSKNEVGFTIQAQEAKMIPALADYIAVVLGYKKVV